MIEKIRKFFKDMIKEMKLVTWPNKHDIKEGTTVVVIMSAIVGIFLASVDQIFTFFTSLLY
ncbi:MAG: preprotein translocase subunit SecE [Candidatus Cloacimonetes bacterium]|nr:preprotein translocase subunit SecE [Candidatus Cloacimonadota bacterium]